MCDELINESKCQALTYVLNNSQFSARHIQGFVDALRRSVKGGDGLRTGTAFLFIASPPLTPTTKEVRV